MPCVRISTGKWAEGLEKELMEAVQSALVCAFKIPESDRDVVLDLYDESRRLVSHGRSERYTRVEIIGIAKRSLNAKRALFKTIVENLQSVGVPKLETRIVLMEPPGDGWGVNDGILASEAEWDFKIDV